MSTPSPAAESEPSVRNGSGNNSNSGGSTTGWASRPRNVMVNGNQSKLEGGNEKKEGKEAAFDVRENQSQALEILCLSTYLIHTAERESVERQTE